MRVVPGTIIVDRGRIKVAHRVERGHATGVPGGLEYQGVWSGAAAGE